MLNIDNHKILNNVKETNSFLNKFINNEISLDLLQLINIYENFLKNIEILDKSFFKEHKFLRDNSLYLFRNKLDNLENENKLKILTINKKELTLEIYKFKDIFEKINHLKLSLLIMNCKDKVKLKQLLKKLDNIKEMLNNIK